MGELKRMWINQPSTLDRLHHLHGVNVLADGTRVYFLSGPTISMETPRQPSPLSNGWRVSKKNDRIEELEAENRLLRDAVYIDDLTVTMQADDRSKAMVAMKRALDFLNADMPTEAKTALRATLTELTGGKDE